VGTGPKILKKTVDQLCESYNDPDVNLNHLKESGLPNQQIVLDILAGVKDLLFPDHRLAHSIRKGETPYLVGGILEKLHEDLRHQICLARNFTWQGDGSCPDNSGQAELDGLTFIGKLPGVRQMLTLDAEAAMAGDPAAISVDEIILCYPGFEAITTFRIAHELHLLGVPLLPRVMTESAHNQTGTDIHPGATIDESFFIDHATGVVIGETTIIGKRVKLYQGVTLGGLRPHKGQAIKGTKRHPTIEDDVVIFAGATVLGGETVIGRGSKIGGSCWITKPIPPGTTVMLNDPKMTYTGGEG
jgi:serine O-acetyltransferase